MKKTMSIVLIAVLISGLLGYLIGSKSPSDKMYKSPEKAVHAFFKYIGKGEFNKLASMIPANYISENFDLEESIDEWHLVDINLSISGNKDTEFFREISQTRLRSNFLSEVYGMIVSLETGSNTDIHYVGNESDFDDIEDAMSIDEMEDIELKAIYLRDDLPKGFETRADIYGFDEIMELIVCFEYDGDKVAVGMTIVEIDDKYALESLRSISAQLLLEGNLTSGNTFHWSRDSGDILEDNDFKLIWGD